MTNRNNINSRLSKVNKQLLKLSGNNGGLNFKNLKNKLTFPKANLSGSSSKVFGIIGVILGVGISKLVEIGIHATGVTFISAYFSWYLIVGALSFSFIVGVLSGILPAMQAAKLITVDALRYE